MNKIPIEELIGKRFGRLIILEEVNPHIKASGKEARKFLCLCDCGNKTEVLLDKLRQNRTTSCGCFHSERLLEMNKTHGLYYHPLRQVHNGIIQRCCNSNNPGYKYYGGRGISVCEEWKTDFMPFYNWAMNNGYQKGLEIDRIITDGNYEPNNCRWITSAENNRNKRNNVLNENLVIQIRELNQTQKLGKRKIAELLDINVSTVGDVLSGKTWN